MLGRCARVALGVLILYSLTPVLGQQCYRPAGYGRQTVPNYAGHQHNITHHQTIHYGEITAATFYHGLDAFIFTPPAVIVQPPPPVPAPAPGPVPVEAAADDLDGELPIQTARPSARTGPPAGGNLLAQVAQDLAACAKCHTAPARRGPSIFQASGALNTAADANAILEAIKSGDMPPAGKGTPPGPAAQARLAQWVQLQGSQGRK